jgi:hypothetical protein
MMSELIAAVIGAIVGALVGAFVNDWRAKASEQKKRDEETRVARLAIASEVDWNLRKLKDFWDAVCAPANGQAEEHTKYTRLISLHFAAGDRRVLDSQLALLPTITSEQEILALLEFYSDLEWIKDVVEELSMAKETDIQQFLQETSPGAAGYRASPARGYKPPENFAHLASKCWSECEIIVGRLIEKGNPLKQKESTDISPSILRRLFRRR